MSILFALFVVAAYMTALMVASTLILRWLLSKWKM